MSNNDSTSVAVSDQVIHGDCTSVLRTLPGESIDAVITDPPYLVGYKDRCMCHRVAVATLAHADLIGALQTMLELVLEAGRPVNRAILQAIFSRTPRGRQLGEAAREVNRALQALRGQTLSEFRVSPGGPSRHNIVIETDRCRLTLEIDRAGARVAALETG